MSQAGCGYLSVKPNAGLPELVNGDTFYKETADEFADAAIKFADYGARLIGGCCGSTPEYIAALKSRAKNKVPVQLPIKQNRVITSTVKFINIEEIDVANIGRIDAEIDSKLTHELKNNNLGYIEDLALDIACESYDAVHICVDLIDDSDDLLTKVLNIAQGYIREPFIIETANPVALEKALRNYRGIAGVVLQENVSDKFKNIIKKYGSEIIERII
jgi:5-methyltetrahydrofolate--homocysteine methyltransferase